MVENKVQMVRVRGGYMERDLLPGSHCMIEFVAQYFKTLKE
jgi:hypothetical protein